MTVALLSLAFLMAWAGSTLIIDEVLSRRHRPSLAERLTPYAPPSVADEAEMWLRWTTGEGRNR